MQLCDFAGALSYIGINVLDESPYVRMYGNLHSDSTSNVLGYKNPDMDALLGELKTAPTADERRRVLENIQTLVNETAPIAVMGAGKYFIPWSQDAHGIVPSADGIMLFEKAWLATDSAS